jgi:hypothetical protein
MNDQCHDCKIRKLCYLEEPKEDWTCDHYEPCEYDEEDATDINVGDKDTISRKAAIDALTEYGNGRAVFISVGEAVIRIEQLPPAQPERTCVNCGRTANNGGWYADGRTRCPIEEHYALPKDGYCHLWEKRNVTDDDYPERRTDEE